jgi:ribosomal-protein-serine acetyltransferase
MLKFSLGNDADLRLLLPHHAPVYSALVIQNTDYLSRWLPWVTADFDEAKAGEIIRQYLQRLMDDAGILYGIFYQEKFSGWISHRWERRFLRTEIGYWIGEQYQGKGLVTRATKAMTDYAFGELGLKRSEIICEVGNDASAAVPQRLGYTFEGVRRKNFFRDGLMRDVNVYVAFADEWPSNQQR